jgi:tRNA-specific 2-thiouridylase
MRCNGAFRFDALATFAERIGAGALWTGHYARVVERSGMRFVSRGADPAKDQSYMLATVDPARLDRIVFPLGGDTKAEVRSEAEGAGLAAARRPESQEACFLAGGDYRSFLARNGLAPSPGDIVDEAGTVLGRHEGLWRFTPGQRRGVGVAAPEPLHVLRSDRGSNTLVVGPRSALGARHVTASGRLYDSVVEVDAKLRYRSPAVAAEVTPTEDGFELELRETVDAVAPGQVAVLYDGDVVVGAGIIERVAG